jgi:multiple sugar transport system permease protein
MRFGNQAMTNRKKEKIILNLWCYLFLSMTLVFYILFQGWPIVSSIYYSTIKWSGLTTGSVFIGLENYKNILQDELYWNAFFNSFKFTVKYVPIILVISMLLALVLNSKTLGAKNVYRTLFFVPVVTTASIIGIIMIFIFGSQGPLNVLLKKLAITNKSISFLSSGKYAFNTVVAIAVWKDCGTYMIYWIAGLQSVPREMYEAAELDGASPFTTFFKIVLPLIAPIAGIITILCTINSLKVFDIIKTMTEGGPFYKTDVVGTYVYRLAFSSEIGLPRVGYASSGAIIFGITVIFIVFISNLLRSKFKKQRTIF